MNFLQYKNAENLISKTGWDLKTALTVVEAELKRLKQGIKEA